MNVNTAVWDASLKLSDPKFADRFNDQIPAETLCNEYHAVLDRAISIVCSQPFMKDARRGDGETFHHLVINRLALTATLTWSRRGQIDRCDFPSYLLDLGDGAINAWKDQQASMIGALMPKAAE